MLAGEGVSVCTDAARALVLLWHVWVPVCFGRILLYFYTAKASCPLAHLLSLELPFDVVDGAEPRQAGLQ